MDLSIIIVSYNTASITMDCIRSIKESDIKLKYEIILVDNNSSDGSVSLIEKEFPKVRIIANKQNNWFAKANNQGAKIAQGNCLLLLNSDTLVEGDNLDKLCRFLVTSKENIACAGPLILNHDRSIQSRGYALPSVMERITMCFKLHKLLPKSLGKILLPIGTPGLIDESHQVGWISGSCMMIRRDVYSKVGGLNEDMEFYGEEPEFGWRLLKQGYETWFYSSARIIHLGGASTKKQKSRAEEERALWRYKQLQYYTVGIKKAIWMSRVVVIAAYVKKIFANNKKIYKDGIEWEKRVIDYLKQHRYEKNLD